MVEYVLSVCFSLPYSLPLIYFITLKPELIFGVCHVYKDF